MFMSARVAATLVYCLVAAAGIAHARRPNILIITADNLGYGDLALLRPASPVISPYLDRLAAEGAVLTQFYTASPTCTVSRASLLTGRVPRRHGLTNQLPGIAGNYGRGLDPAELLLPQLLERAGYTSGCFGKWNIGFAPGSRPTERGFDEFFGHASGNIDYYTHNYNGKHDLYRGIEEAHVEGYAPDLFADAAIEFIRARSRTGEPWFVYLPFNAPHFPNPRNKGPGEPNIWQAPDDAFAAYGWDPATTDPKARYYAVITALDSAIGRVLETLEDLDLADTTWVFFYSDNGAFMLEDRGLEVASNGPLRDGGVTCWEGGIRVVAVTRFPGAVPPGTVVAEPLWSPDLFATCAGLADVTLPDDRTIDGRDMLPVLRGEQDSPHESFYFRFRNHAALRQGDWKIVRSRPDASWQLFDLGEDEGESRNVAGEFPRRVESLAERFRRWEQSIDGERRAVDESRSREDDPLSMLRDEEIAPLVDVVLDNYRSRRTYPDDRFPMSAESFRDFRRHIVGAFEQSLGLEEWTVRQPLTRRSPLSQRFSDRVLQRITHQGVVMEVHVVEFPDSGLRVPMVLCLPLEESDTPVPGVCVFSGHTGHGLRDLLNPESYQGGLAVECARAGMAAIAVEKIDTGFLSRHGTSGVDENETATTLLYWGEVTRAHQLKACLVSAEILAAHPRVDPSRIGAAGVSLGGWLSIQTALLSDRITAVADFGRKTLTIPPGVTTEQFGGVGDLCHILPGMLSLCDRNVMALAYCPRPLLAGHGRRDAGSHREGPVHYETLFRNQYALLGQEDRYHYHVHDGGDSMPVDVVIAWFDEQFAMAD